MSNPRTRKTDRFLAILLTFMMVIGMLPVSVYAGPTEFPDKFTVTVKDENNTPVYGAAVTYTLKVDGEEKLSDQSTESTNSDGIAAIDLSVYEENITAGTVTISVTVSKDPFFEDATVQDEAVTDATGNIDITLLSRTVTVTGTVNDHENNPVDGAAVEFSGAEMVNPVTYTGADGSFTLYEDAGDGYGYERGEYCLTHVTYREEDGHLSWETEGDGRFRKGKLEGRIMGGMQ